jgi:hypothetical protein
MTPTAAARGPAVRAACRALGDRRAPPDPAWISRLTGASRAEIDEVLEETAALLPYDRAIGAAHRAAGRSSYAQIRAPFELYAIVRLTRPDHVVEAGVSSGVSSAHFLLALRRNHHGTLHSIDWPTFAQGATPTAKDRPISIPRGKRSGWAIPDRLRPGWDLRIGRSEALLPKLVAELPSIGVFLHDDLHTPSHLTFELNTIEPKLAPGAVVLADNTVWTGAAFPRWARRLGVRWYRRRRSDLVGLRTPGSPSPRGR